jgi:Fic family protein
MPVLSKAKLTMATEYPSIRKAGRKSGMYVLMTTGEKPFRAYIPNALPPNPPVEMESLHDLETSALLALGRLDAVTGFLPDKHLFLYSYVRKEAVLSSQIEGTQSSLSDLLLFENDAAPGVPIDDVEEVLCYVKALNYGLEQIRLGIPIHNRLIRDIHSLLLSSGRGRNKMPGEFRRVQNRIGGTDASNARFVPPPPMEIERLMDDFERFLNDEPVRTRPLAKAALMHVQFETIHPFLDGNGRMGRLLISLLFAREKVLHDPLLYLSLYFKTNRDRYYDLLQRVRTEGDWEAWFEFFFRGVTEVAEGAASTAHKLLTLFEGDKKRIASELKRAAAPALRIHDLLTKKIVISGAEAVRNLEFSAPTIYNGLARLRDLGIAREITGKARYGQYVYEEYRKILNEGAEP